MHAMTAPTLPGTSSEAPCGATAMHGMQQRNIYMLHACLSTALIVGFRGFDSSLSRCIKSSYLRVHEPSRHARVPTPRPELLQTRLRALSSCVARFE